MSLGQRNCRVIGLETLKDMNYKCFTPILVYSNLNKGLYYLYPGILKFQVGLSITCLGIAVY